jgi:hypothetical protein
LTLSTLLVCCAQVKTYLQAQDDVVPIEFCKAHILDQAADSYKRKFMEARWPYVCKIIAADPRIREFVADLTTGTHRVWYVALDNQFAPDALPTVAHASCVSFTGNTSKSHRLLLQWVQACKRKSCLANRCCNKNRTGAAVTSSQVELYFGVFKRLCSCCVSIRQNRQSQ